MEGVDNGVAIYGSEVIIQVGRWAGKSGFKVFDPKIQDEYERVVSSMRMTLKGYKLLAFLLVIAWLAVASIDNQKASGVGVFTQTREAASNKLVWLDNYQAAIKESKATGKPIFLEFRCGP